MQDERKTIEDEIERQGLWSQYLLELIDLLGIYGDRSYYDWDREWADAVRILLRATPEQCRIAAERAMRGG